VDADVSPAPAAAPDQFEPTRLVDRNALDRNALDRANRSRTLFSSPFGPPASAATLADGPAGQPVPLSGGAIPVSAQAADAGITSAQATPPDRFEPTGLIDRLAFDRATRSRTPVRTAFGPTPPAPTLSNGSTGEPARFAVSDGANVAAMDPGSASESHQSSSGQGSFDRVSRDQEQMLADRAIDAAAAVSFHVDHGAPDPARLLEVAGVGALQTADPAATQIPAPADASIAIPDERDLRHQIVQGIKFQWRDGVGDVKLTLHPEYLGEMTVTLRVDQGGVTAQLSADSPSVRAWAMANEPLLRQGLAEQGLTLSRLVVTEDAPESSPDRESRRRAPQQETPEPPAPRRSDTATFEIVL